jgi:hypothetical protein
VKKKGRGAAPFFWRGGSWLCIAKKLYWKIKSAAKINCLNLEIFNTQNLIKFLEKKSPDFYIWFKSIFIAKNIEACFEIFIFIYVSFVTKFG